MLKFIKDWVLPIAMITGALTHRWVSHLSFLMPYLIFLMLLFTFAKISLKEIRFHRAHLFLLLIQLLGSMAVFLLLRPFDAVVAQGAMLCVFAPTATAAAVITGMLGGNVGFLTAYVLFCNITVAVTAPLYFTMIGIQGGDMTFIESVWFICRKVLPLLIMPLFVALAIRRWTPRVHRVIMNFPRMAFYLWAISLTIVTARTVDYMLHQSTPAYKTEAGLIVVSFVLCVVQFVVGRRIGRHYGDPISSGQGLGQKNTILAIWMAQTYLHPLTAIAPSGYILWQNIINSWQLWKERSKRTKQ